MMRRLTTLYRWKDRTKEPYYLGIIRVIMISIVRIIDYYPCCRNNYWFVVCLN